MTRSTIDFGIDLGTTNSSIAVLSGTEAEVIRNNENSDTTPSAVWIDAKGSLYVGRQAREHVESDAENSAAEFKLVMGTKGQGVVFRSSGRTMEPEELSAEVLKSLRGDVQQRRGEEISAAVITVPAAFDLNQCDATNRAARLAGLTTTPLVQEPNAAAAAYSFRAEVDNAFWLVYDLGGGTFDAAVIHLREGEFSVVNHRGDNFLGGKLIDWQIVERLLIPALIRDRPLEGFGRGERKWIGAVAKLKREAEEAKILLSRYQSAGIDIDFLCNDDRNEPVQFHFELRRDQVEALAEPFYLRSINLCKQALAEKRLGAGDVEKLILVGGPTLTPYLRERLADPAEGLGISLEHGEDPLTVVARGAAIFAGAQRLETPSAPPRSGQLALQLDYKPIEAETEPLVGGRLSSVDDVDLSTFTVEFVNADARPPWRSGRVALAAGGTFMTTLWADAGRRITFHVQAVDGAGRSWQVEPEQFDYIPSGPVPDRPTLTHSIGVGLANNQMAWFLPKGCPLPADFGDDDFRTSVELRRGQRGGVIKIPVMEGEHDLADRNRCIGTLEVKAEQVWRDVPVESEVEISIHIDASRVIHATAHVPVLRQEFEDVIDLKTEVIPESGALEHKAELERSRLVDVRARSRELKEQSAQDRLQRIHDEGLVAEIDGLIAASRTDPDAAATCDKRIRDLRAALDEVEAALEWPELVSDADEAVSNTRDVVQTRGEPDEKQDLRSYEQRTREAIESHDARHLRDRVEELWSLTARVLDRTGELPLSRFKDLKTRKAEILGANTADLLAQGDRAVEAGDIMTLRQVNARLQALLPDAPAPEDRLSDVMRWWA